MEKYKNEKKKLNELQYSVTQENATEKPYTGKYDNFNREGIYVDVVSGEPLFSSLEKFNAGCGWPSFTSAINDENIIVKGDNTHGMNRTEVRSKDADSHLGHVFQDGPIEHGGLRYCINSAALKFIPVEDLERLGYQEFKQLFDK